MGHTEGKKILHLQTIEQQKTDSDGVMTTEFQTNVSSFEKEPAYVKVYMEDIGRLNGLTPNEQKLINELVFNMGYNNIVPSYKPVKQEIARRLQCSLEAINKSVQGLYTKGVLIRKARGFYIMDPNLFGRGSWQDIKKIRMTIDYNEDGTKTINTTVSKQLGLFQDDK
jgi:hypothetical protein